MAHHVIDTATPVGDLLQQGVNDLRAAREKIGRAFDIMTAAGGDANIEGGIFGVASSEGAAVYALVGSVNTGVQAVNAAFIDPIDQGG